MICNIVLNPFTLVIGASPVFFMLKVANHTDDYCIRPEQKQLDKLSIKNVNRIVLEITSPEYISADFSTQRGHRKPLT